MRVLIVDDDEISLLVLAESLSDLGYEVYSASDGLSAWKMFGEQEFPVVIVDWMMPYMDGLELTKQIRDTAGETYTYVILLTGRTDREDRLQALESGADDFLTKPVDYAELLARLRVAERILRSESALRDANERLRDARSTEAKLGAQIQQRLLVGRPSEPASGLEVQVLSLPSQEVDGDFCDFYRYAEGVVDLISGDVMGKGIPAALVGAGFKTSLQRVLIGLLGRSGGALPSIGEVVREVTERIGGELVELGTFLTLAFMRLDCKTNRLRYVNFGHPKMIRWDALQNRCEFLKLTGAPLGFELEVGTEEQEIQLGEGDLVIAYSDGVTDLIPREGERLGAEGFSEWISSRAGAPVSDILSELAELRQEFATRGKVDDFTVIAMRLTGGTEAREGVQWFWSEGAIGRIRSIVKCRAERSFDLEADAVAELLIAIQEVVSNAIRHARVGVSGLPIGLASGQDSEAVWVELRYPGVPFSPEEKPEEPTSEYRMGGFGLPLIRKAVDEVEYARTGELNRVTLRKRRLRTTN